MYKRVFTAITAAVIAFFLLILLGPATTAGASNPRGHTVAYTE